MLQNKKLENEFLYFLLKKEKGKSKDKTRPNKLTSGLLWITWSH